MKKFVIGSVLALSAMVVSAFEVGVHTSRDFGRGDTIVGATLTMPTRFVDATVGYDRAVSGSDTSNRYTAQIGYNFMSIGPVKVNAHVGGAYIDSKNSSDGYAMTFGVDGKYPLAKNVNAVLDVTQQFAQTRVSNGDGTRVTLGVGYKF